MVAGEHAPHIEHRSGHKVLLRIEEHVNYYLADSFLSLPTTSCLGVLHSGTRCEAVLRSRMSAHRYRSESGMFLFALADLDLAKFEDLKDLAMLTDSKLREGSEEARADVAAERVSNLDKLTAEAQVKL